MNGFRVVLLIPFAVVLLAVVVAEAALQPTTTPPLLDVPTYSLATRNKDGSTNMNILTYATPISVSPTRVWTLGIYRETLTDENLHREPTAVLQLLTRDHVDLVSILGGNSGRDIDKREECTKRGFPWKRCEEMGGLELLPGCASYLHLCIQGGLVDAGSHLIAPYCSVLGMYEDDTETNGEAQVHLKTGYLRELGVITRQGRVADQVREGANRGFRLQ
jgi:flavin reductase (DIM6/NTAB) family NADH-FMN oxidoreductase RutF